MAFSVHVHVPAKPDYTRYVRWINIFSVVWSVVIIIAHSTVGFPEYTQIGVGMLAMSLIYLPIVCDLPRHGPNIDIYNIMLFIVLLLIGGGIWLLESGEFIYAYYFLGAVVAFLSHMVISLLLD